MVRNMVGVLLSIGIGERKVEWAREVLLVKDRRFAAKTASPDGLYLTKIDYPEAYQLPSTPISLMWD